MIDIISTALSSAIGLVAAALILWRVEPALNRMGRSTHWMIRYALLLVAAGALALAAGIVAGTPPGLDTLLLACALALLLFCDRRLRFLVQFKSGGRHA